MQILYTKHAEDMIVFRSITKKLVEECINSPDKVVEAKEGKRAYIKDFGVNYLKVIVSYEHRKNIVITLYWIAKHRIRTYNKDYEN